MPVQTATGQNEVDEKVCFIYACNENPIKFTKKADEF